MAGNPVVWFEIYVKDMARSKAFYESVLQVKLEPLPAPMPGAEFWAFPGSPEAPGAGGTLVHMEGVPCGGSGTLVYFHCEDCSAEESRVVAAGGTIHRSKMPIGSFGHIVLASDPEGNLVGFHSMR